MNRDETRQRLIDATIYVIAKEGLDKTSTKQIGLASSINEAYIYRCFADKEDMISKAFDQLDEELLDATMRSVGIFSSTELDFVMRCRLYFLEIWEFILSNRDKCLAYVRYFYSPYFIRYSATDHEERFSPFVKKMRSSFKDEADVWMILNHILNVMLDFAVKVHSGQKVCDEDYTEHVFRVIYASVNQYFKNAKEYDF